MSKRKIKKQKQLDTHQAIGVFTEKGGVTKTTTLFFLVERLSRLNQKILVIDADPQCNFAQITCSPSFLKKLPFLFLSDFLIKCDVDGKGQIAYEKGDLSLYNNGYCDVILGDSLPVELENQINDEFKSPLNSNIKNITTKIKNLLSKYNFIFFDMNPSFSPSNRLILKILNDLRYESQQCGSIINLLTCDNFCISSLSRLINFVRTEKMTLDIITLVVLVKEVIDEPTKPFSQYIGKIKKLILENSMENIYYGGYLPLISHMKEFLEFYYNLNSGIINGGTHKHLQWKRFYDKISMFVDKAIIQNKFEKLEGERSIDAWREVVKDGDMDADEGQLYVNLFESKVDGKYYKIGMSKGWTRAIIPINKDDDIVKDLHFVGDLDDIKNVEGKVKKWWKPYHIQGEYYRFTQFTEEWVKLFGKIDIMLDLMIEF